jgi:general secretion pathway protein J
LNPSGINDSRVALTRPSAARPNPCGIIDSRVTFTRKNGFTLIEVLIAMAIFAILAMLAYGGLNAVIESKEQTEQALTRLRQLQLTMSKLQRDIGQVVARDGRDEFGGILYKFSSSADSDLLMEFTRNGWRNPAGLTRSHLQRVGYRLDEDTLLRLSWPYVDRAQDSQAIETTLIDNIKDVKLRFYDGNEWQDNWPDAQALTSGAEVPLPKAVEITLQLNDWGSIMRIFRIPG